MKTGPESHTCRLSRPKAEVRTQGRGVKYFLQKPYMPDEVVRTLQILTEGKS
jgi:hypothetical protein